ncbi:uncharacterized protein LOC108627705 [Ceratina calcarata]|uniref:Uncharacterized protein LOC108627705 n=1 Tax=Ceratina calcarata TaxID=156304 RepID=A0AAJ7WD09_9HYME|nr:uncharacterized protein LOC108627705 [Ceratina calcarata]
MREVGILEETVTANGLGAVSLTDLLITEWLHERRRKRERRSNVIKRTRVKGIALIGEKDFRCLYICIILIDDIIKLQFGRILLSIFNETRDVESSLCSVNTAFTALRTLIPTEPADRKLSKIETLRLASSYINHLGAVLVAGPVDQPCLRVRLRLSLTDEDDDDGCSYEPNRWTDSQRRPQVCTFCLAMHKKFVSRIYLSFPQKLLIIKTFYCLLRN